MKKQGKKKRKETKETKKLNSVNKYFIIILPLIVENF